MKVVNIQRLQYFARADFDPNTNTGAVATFAQFQDQFGFEPGGVNFYIGISQAAQEQLIKEGTPNAALNSYHRNFFNDVHVAIKASVSKVKTVVLGIEPQEASDPYGFVAQAEQTSGWITRTAQELKGIQDEISGDGKLNIIVRYASEMNDRGGSNVWSKRPAAEFIASYRQVRDIFRTNAPAIRFSFSPALREDINASKLAAIKDYFPGKPDDAVRYVDVIGCTWYVGKQADVKGAIAIMQEYFRERKGRNLPFGFDEFGGIDKTQDNDHILAQMMAAMEALRTSDGISFEYATLFLEGKFITDATLNFLDG